MELTQIRAGEYPCVGNAGNKQTQHWVCKPKSKSVYKCINTTHLIISLYACPANHLYTSTHLIQGSWTWMFWGHRAKHLVDQEPPTIVQNELKPPLPIPCPLADTSVGVLKIVEKGNCKYPNPSAQCCAFEIRYPNRSKQWCPKGFSVSHGPQLTWRWRWGPQQSIPISRSKEKMTKIYETSSVPFILACI